MKKKFKSKDNSKDIYNPPVVSAPIDFYYANEDDNFYPEPVSNMDIIDDVIDNEVITNEKIIDKLMEIEARARIEADAVMLEARRKQYELLMNRMTACNCYNMRVMCSFIDKEN